MNAIITSTLLLLCWITNHNKNLSPSIMRTVVEESKCRLYTVLVVVAGLLALSSPCVQAAGDPLYKSWSRRRLSSNSRSVLVSSHKPWRTTISKNSDKYYRPPSPIIPFMDIETVRSDPGARVYQLDLKSRRPNQYSITSRIVMLTLACFGLQVFSPSVTGRGIKLSDKILSGKQLYRLVTPIFLHGGIFHLFNNMVSLQRVGNDVEKLFGPGRYLATYMVSGVVGNIFSAYRSPNPSLGASGAVFGIVGAYFVFLTRNEWLLGSAGHSMTNSIGQTMLFNVMLGLANPKIDQWAHLGGALAGAAVAYAIGPRLYMSEYPGEGRFVVDRPILRGPSYLEDLPKKISLKFHQLTNIKLPSSTIPRPWKRHSQDYGPRQGTPNRSIKPGPVD